MGSDEALLALANTAIEREIRAHFPYTALYRRLCKGGWERAADYLYREFAPALVGPAGASIPAMGDSIGGPDGSSAGPPLPQRKRRRTSLVEELQKGLEAFTAATLQPAETPLKCGASAGKPYAVHESVAEAVLSTALEASAMPYSVICRRCTTHVTSAYPCQVLESYVVLWAESVLEVECAAGKAAAAALSLESPKWAANTHGSSSGKGSLGLLKHSDVAHTGDSQSANGRRPPLRSSLCSSLHPMGLRPLLHRISRAFAHPLERSAEEAVASPAPSVVTATSQAAHSLDPQRHIFSNTTHSWASTVPTTPTAQMIRLHSLHIVSSDVVSNPRPASFAVQSLLLPGWQTALECYPRHMLHFGLLVYAAWHANPRTWRSVLSEGGTDGNVMGVAGSGHRLAALPSRSSRSGAALPRMCRKRAASEAAATAAAPRSLSGAPEAGQEAYIASLAELLPCTAHDAVLVLGLGGNVLGQCLDALLPPSVPLHIVEVEPAVLLACCEHGQFPAIDAVLTCEALKPAAFPYRRKGSPLRSAGTADTTATAAAGACPAASLGSRAPMEWVADLIHRRSATPVAFRATRQEATSLMEGLTAPLPARPSRAAKGTKCAPGWGGAAAEAAETPLQSQRSRGEYVCFLQDAYTYLRGGTSFPASATVPRGAAARHRTSRAARAAAHPVASSLPLQADRPWPPAHARIPPSTRGAASAATAAAAPSLVQYSLIFLDCYDPNKERMMHEETLVELCARRLRPGGVLLVNAHVLPTVGDLRRDFFRHEFATVQALRVAGCMQTVVVCVAHDAAVDVAPAGAAGASGSAGCAPLLAEKRGRFTVRQMRLLAAALNRSLKRNSVSTPGVTVANDDTGGGAASPAVATGTTAFSSSHPCSPLPSYSVTPAFLFDAAWLKSCRRVAALPTRSQRRSRSSPASTMTSQACCIDVDLHVWEHFF
ncbi:hypothetical protein LSCM1_03201 [Leishmania martiniquensis]|uniref:Uncharacterized protein n=1 Tax=Leishmania martiniquensis TaxID=1580590 RepID=A0A836GIM8_9TRYP|nr:hypothetical protein LSCM1_03201 [Leishmania martiniquensis]